MFCAMLNISHLFPSLFYSSLDFYLFFDSWCLIAFLTRLLLVWKLDCICVPCVCGAQWVKRNLHMFTSIQQLFDLPLQAIYRELMLISFIMFFPPSRSWLSILHLPKKWVTDGSQLTQRSMSSCLIVPYTSSEICPQEKQWFLNIILSSFHLFHHALLLR